MKKQQEYSRSLDEAERTITKDQPDPKLEEVDDSASGRFGPVSAEDAWVPGMIEVVFRKASQSGVETDFFERRERKEFSKAWPERLRSVLISYGLVSWKASFPLRYPWSIESDDEAHKNYKASGRDKFVTFNFPREAETRRIADELRELPELEQAVAVPRIGPPSGPLHEPLMGTTDQPVNTVCGPSGCLTSQWYIFRCHVDQAWNRSTASGKGVTIADIDWGFNRDHQDLTRRIKETRNMFPNPPNPIDVNFGSRCDHGTAALGLAGAEVNGRGMAGVAFGADLWAIQGGMDSIADHSLWVAGINFVRTHPGAGRRVIMLEIQTILGGNIEMIPTIRAEIMAAIGDNIVVCVPAGNSVGDAGIDDDRNPIPLTGSILVGATRFDASANILGGSKSGCRVVVYAPGDRGRDLTCGFPSNDSYRNGFGFTSGAVPKVAGAVALMLEKNPQLTHAQVREILSQSQIPVVDDSSNQVGVLLNAEQAVCEALHRAGGQC